MCNKKNWIYLKNKKYENKNYEKIEDKNYEKIEDKKIRR